MSCEKSQSIIFDETPPDRSRSVEFRLIYSGRVLSASREKTRADIKHEIRREFHPQLRRLWNTNESLREIVKRYGYAAHASHEREYYEFGGYGMGNRDCTGYDSPECDSLYREMGTDILSEKWVRSGFRFWPLVTEEYCLRCALDILFLRPEKPGMLIKSGDIDARIKTIFDALRMPKNLDETGRMGPQVDEDPFFCLLEDDKLISEIKVNTDNLLMLPKEREIRPNDALLVIHVKLWPSRDNTWKWAFS
jgi:hypothetical protein